MTARNDELSRWRSFADQRLSPIEDMKGSIRKIREDLDRRFPAWRESYEFNPTDYMNHDARREYFVSLQGILQNSQLGFIFIRDNLTDQEWYRKQTGEYRDSAALQALREYALMIKFFAFHAIAVSTEETCRAIVHADSQTFHVDPSGAFQTLYKRVLSLSDCEQYHDLFEIMRLTRNTIHTNGVYRPASLGNRTISYGGRTFTFQVGTILNWMGDDFPEWLANQLSRAMEAIVKSDLVCAIQVCHRG